MKKFQFLGAIAFALLLSLNANVLLDSNNWDTTEEVAEAQQLNVRPLALGPVHTITLRARMNIFPCDPSVPGTIRTSFIGCLNGAGSCARTNCFT